MERRDRIGLRDSGPAVLTFRRRYVTNDAHDALTNPSGAAGRPGLRAASTFDREPGLADALIGQTGYFGIFLVLVLGGLGLPVPE